MEIKTKNNLDINIKYDGSIAIATERVERKLIGKIKIFYGQL